MNAGEFAKSCGYKVLAGGAALEKGINGVYVCDLLSWVMSHAGKGDIWITVHTHINIIAVALLTEVSCIVVPESITVEEATIHKAEEEGIALFSAPVSGYEVCCSAKDRL